MDRLHQKAVCASPEGKSWCLGSRKEGGLGERREGFTEEVILNKSGTHHMKKQLSLKKEAYAKTRVYLAGGCGIQCSGTEYKYGVTTGIGCGHIRMQIVG